MNIVVLAGGLSPERDVSLSSGSLIANALTRKGHKVLLVDLYKGLEENNFEKLFSQEQKKYEFKILKKEPNLDKIKNQKELIGKNVIEVCKYADIVFMALHGSIGENGKLQAVFDCLGVKYTGTGYEGSLLAMNKILTKKILNFEKITTPKWFKYDEKTNMDNIKFPIIVKPASNGSSIGVNIAHNKDEFEKAIKNSKKHGEDIIIEEFIEGREFSVAVLDNKALEPIEIIPKKGFYDYKNKYQNGLTNEVCPSNLDKRKIIELKHLALKVHKALELGSYSRSDFRLSENGKFYCLEANTLPGMTPTSLMPQEALVEGINYDELCDRIVSSNY